MINKLHFPRTSCNGAFAEVAIHWLSTVVSGWEKLSQKSYSIGCQPWFPDGEKIRRSLNSLVINRGFRMEKNFAEVAIHWLSTVVSGWEKIFAVVA